MEVRCELLLLRNKQCVWQEVKRSKRKKLREVFVDLIAGK